MHRHKDVGQKKKVFWDIQSLYTSRDPWQLFLRFIIAELIPIATISIDFFQIEFNIQNREFYLSDGKEIKREGEINKTVKTKKHIKNYSSAQVNWHRPVLRCTHSTS